jgi:RimJ/RimL family protein N-acetyltransferase
VRQPEPVVLTRGRVRLEPLGPEHDVDLLAAAQDDEVWRWMPIRRPSEPATVREAQSGMAWAVVVDGRAQGTTSYLDVDAELGGLEIGWTWYARALWATEVNPTCKLLLLGHAFDDLGADRVTLKTDGLNTRSQAAIRKLGCAHDGTLRHQRRRPDGTVRDAAFFSMLRAEWPAARARLEGRLPRGG